MAIEMGAFEAKTHFSELIDRVQKGAKVTITKRGVPVAQVLPVLEHKRVRLEIVQKLSSYQKKSSGSFDIREAINDGRK